MCRIEEAIGDSEPVVPDILNSEVLQSLPGLEGVAAARGLTWRAVCAYSARVGLGF